MSTQWINKQLLSRQFRRAADSYESQAFIQKKTAEHLLDLLIEHNSHVPQRVLEIGCGTGLLTRRLAQRFNGIQELVLNDLVPDFASRLNIDNLAPAITFLPGDIEDLPLPGTFDLIISSSTLHWLHDLDRLLDKATTHLSPRGCLAFSLYGPDNLQEIRALTGIGIDYCSQPEIEAKLRRHFRLIHSSGQQEVLYFSNPHEVLRHLRQTGVNAVKRSPWNRTILEQFCTEYYSRFSQKGKVMLTCHPLYFVALLS